MGEILHCGTQNIDTKRLILITLFFLSKKNIMTLKNTYITTT